MTASEKRADGMEYVFQVNIAEVNIKCEKSNTLDPTVVVCNYNHSSGELRSCPDRVAMKGMYLNLISKNQHRNHYIAEQGAVAFNEGRVTVIMSDRIAQLKDIHTFLVNKFNIPPKDIGFYLGANTKKENKRVADNCKLILATYGMMSRGTDIQRLSTLIIATPRNEMIQVAGRIERALPGKPFPVILDIVDNMYSISRSGLSKRLSYYFGRNLRVLEKTCP
jgi:superfamily II DNA or RNA helicase